LQYISSFVFKADPSALAGLTVGKTPAVDLLERGRRFWVKGACAAERCRAGSGIMRMEEDIVPDGDSVRSAHDKNVRAGYRAARWQKITNALARPFYVPSVGASGWSWVLPADLGRITKVAAMFFGSVVGIDAQNHTPYPDHKALMTIFEAALGEG
jgi:hypothetical protein